MQRIVFYLTNWAMPTCQTQSRIITTKILTTRSWWEQERGAAPVHSSDRNSKAGIKPGGAKSTNALPALLPEHLLAENISASLNPYFTDEALWMNIFTFQGISFQISSIDLIITKIGYKNADKNVNSGFLSRFFVLTLHILTCLGF